MVSENDMDLDDVDVVDEDQSESDIELDEICPLRDDSKVVYQGHTNAILCVELDESRNIIYTGGMDDKVIAWEMNTGKLIYVLSGHGDSITNIAVHNSGEIVATGDLQGSVIIWKRVGSEERWEKIHEIETASIKSLTWNQDLLFVCDSVGTVQSWSITDLRAGPNTYKYGIGCSCSKFCLILNGAWDAVLYGESCDDHEECSNTSSLHLNRIGTERSVKIDLRTLPVSHGACNEDEPDDEGLGAAWDNKAIGESHMIAIGDWGRIIFVSITGQGYSVNHKLNSVEIKTGGLVDNVAFSPTLNYVAFSTKKGLMGVYDVTKNLLRHTWNYSQTMPVELRTQSKEEEDSSVSQLSWSPCKPVFYTAGLDGRLCEWDGRMEPVGEVPTQWGYSGIVWDMKVSRDGSTIVLVSEDKVGRAFSL